MRTLVEQCYDIGPSPAEAIADFAVSAGSLVADLAALEPVGGNEMCAHARPDMYIIGSHGGTKAGEV